ncbi:hypothetical protein OR1_03492 [Geobacter sp. OR-1]|uniref:hypothetical protein n=1 Tax=Geobacter sp. OR-1 TaxID=1266765 RepID=UPI0005423E12|nr:hypothetical protein [Geobacter sp. OR-1]GAM11182.1 hypothetical protein OR1_03492 [Geobacter sp. OR-1]
MLFSSIRYLAITFAAVIALSCFPGRGNSSTQAPEKLLTGYEITATVLSSLKSGGQHLINVKDNANRTYWLVAKKLTGEKFWQAPKNRKSLLAGDTVSYKREMFQNNYRDKASGNDLGQAMLVPEVTFYLENNQYEQKCSEYLGEISISSSALNCPEATRRQGDTVSTTILVKQADFDYESYESTVHFSFNDIVVDCASKKVRINNSSEKGFTKGWTKIDKRTGYQKLCK